MYKSFILALSFALMGRAIDLTYWIDSSCDPYPQVPEAIVDAIRIGANVTERIQRGAGDRAFEMAFQTTMKVPLDNTNVYKAGDVHGFPKYIVNYITSSIATLKPAPFAPSNIRFYCDNDPYQTASNPDARWALVPDRESDPIPNSRKIPGRTQEFVDKVNFIRRSTSTLGCQESLPPRMETFAHPITPDPINGVVVPAGFPDMRSTISLCTAFMETNTGEVTTWQKITASVLDFYLSQGGFLTHGVNDIFSSTIYHELHHVVPFKLVDELGPQSYGWEQCMAFTDSQSLRNVQNHMFLGGLAQLEQRKVRLSYDTTQAIAGQIEKDASLPLVS